MPLYPDGMIPTKAHGPLPESALMRTDGVIDGPEEFRVWIEFRLPDTAEVAILRKLEFSKPVADARGSWETCARCTASRQGGHTPSCDLAPILRAADARAAELLARFEFVSFAKVDIFAAYPGTEKILIEEDGVRSEADVASLEKKTGADDNPQAWVPWVEFRRPGEDKILHRSIHPHIKRGLQLGGSQGTAAAAELTI